MRARLPGKRNSTVIGVRPEDALQRSVPKPRGGKNKKQKGDRFERECVAQFLENGIFAERVPLSGAAGGSFGSDIQVHLPNLNDHWSPIKKFECKSRAQAWKDLYDYLKPEVHALLIKRDRSEALVVLRLQDFIDEHKQDW